MSGRPAALALLIALAFAGCTRPAPVTAPPEAIRETLTAEMQASRPSLTPPPSATPVGTPATQTPAASLAEATSSPTPPPLATDDPRYGLNLAAPHYWDDFSSSVTWVGPNFEGAANIWDDGRLRATDYLADTFIWWSTTIPDVETGNLYVEVNAQAEACSGKDAYGLAVRVDPVHRNSGYTLEFSCDGAFRIRKLFAGSIRTLLDWQSSEAIRPGPEGVNTMGFLAEATSLTAFANGEVLARLEDSSFSRGNFGLFANASETPGLTVYFDDFKLWYIAR